MSSGLTDEQLLELQREAALGRLLASVAHGFSTPAGAILSNAETEMRLLDRLERALGEPSLDRARELVAASRGLLEVNRLAAERIAALVKSLKTAARAGEPELLRVDLNRIVSAALQLAQTEFKDRIGFQTDFGEIPEVECYPSPLTQAILNLLANAGQAIEETGSVTVGTRAENGQAHIWVSDTGRGIREEDKSKILQRGFTTKPVGLGTGLGLSIVKEIVTRRHSGAVDFESQWGKGTTFHVRIPLTQNVGRASACPACPIEEGA
jgi:signal transduction histidine kinase